jgi:transketolase
LASLYGRVLHIPKPEDPDRDRFILSKGQAALALYAALHLAGWLSQDDLLSYCGEGTLLGVHPEFELRGVDFATGSLGQGLSIGVGAALAARQQGSTRRVFVLVSDAECNEGSLWEAVMSAAHFKLSNLVVIVDLNGQQALGYTDDVMNLSPLGPRWEAFGWDVHEVNGHCPTEIACTIEALDLALEKPHVLIAHTISGKGVSFMEHQVRWHYMPMSETEYRQAMSEIVVGE